VSEAEVNLSGKDMIERYQELSKDSILSRSLYFDAFERLEKCAKEGAAPRIVVFVDDLDRCFPDKAVELIEHIKLVLNQRGFAFVLGVNEDIIQAVVKTKFEKDYKIDPAYAEDYLDKIVQVKVPVPQREPGDMGDYIGALLDEGNVFSSALKEDLVPLIAEACRRNPRSIVRLLNRVMVTYWVGQLEKKSFDPLALLIHLATDEHRYSAFREALDVSIVLEGESVSKTIGCYLSDGLKAFTGSVANLIPSLREVKPLSRGDVLEKAIEILYRNRYLCNLLRSEIGRQWLRDEDGLRHRVGEVSESTLGERKTKEESKGPIPLEIEDPIANC
jgi:hypothetical protein